MATAIICEFNPFHNGHAYLLSEAKRLTGEPNMVIMSGSFTQRGEVAVCDKFTRAAAALRHGADLVVELPTAFAVANAERFAQGGVRIAKFFSGVHTLAFGCETDNLDALRAAAAAIRSERVNALIAAEMRGGGYYPRALEEALRTVCGGEVAAAVSSPNNILAVEYIRALEGTEIRPLPIMRQGAAHDSDKTSGGFASASYIRSLLREGKNCADLLPEIPRHVTRPELLDRAVLYRLRTMTAEELRALPEVGEGLENRILEAAGRAQSETLHSRAAAEDTRLRVSGTYGGAADHARGIRQNTRFYRRGRANLALVHVQNNHVGGEGAARKRRKYATFEP